ncbi:MAG: aminopeptidase [Oscillibacter sp.]|nr:aminopeptidase [Oscillibacter sp.]
MDKKLREYADLLICVGLNIQKGQTLVISSPVECAGFARICAERAYGAGCREVVMNWRDDILGRMKYLHAADGVFNEVPLWRRHFFNDYALEGAAFLSIDATNPENFQGVKPDRIVRAQQASGAALKDFDRLQMHSGFPWCIASIPIPSWAKKVFPGVSEEQAMDKLWDAIFQVIRISGDGKCVKKWKQHLDTLEKRVEKLNALNFKTLHYRNKMGTDLTVELPEGHIWESGGDRTPSGQEFIANIPTEEIFTAPLKTGVNGVVYSTMPLVNDGNIIDHFSFVVKDGKITEIHAGKGGETLRGAVSVDEGACYFGEISLVPYDSPISNQRILYYNTLFDENAACHIAFGEAYPCLKGGKQMTKEELTARGLNASITHVDFMVGSSDLSIEGTTHDGRVVQVFQNGNFAF